MSTVPEFALSRIQIINAHENQNGVSLLAVFDLAIAGMKIRGCAMLKKNGQIQVKGPVGSTHRGDTVRVSLEDAGLIQAVKERAEMIYEGFTGTVLATE
ncbi:MAG: hypothetical protein CML66_14725 [Rhodobacteraceae bacterium]|nr:hypothetical protein [Paracoccaceae bacterium]MAY47170.1 hypothetical protein [Paracoccaceae bacterium]